MPVGPDLELDDRDAAALNGELGAGVALAMRVLVGVARIMGLPAWIDISQAHVDGCLY
jgi:predicted aconitase